MPDGLPLDFVCVVAEANRGWILDRIATELVARHPGRSVVHHGDGPLPQADAYFFTHPSLFPPRWWRTPAVRRARNIVFFTHPSPRRRGDWRADIALRRADHVVSMSSIHVASLLSRGVPRRNIRVIIPGADPRRFRSHDRSGGGTVGLSSAFYQRKNPSAVVDVARLLPHRKFTLIGDGWRYAPEYDDLMRLPNFSYEEVPYEKYPARYEWMDVFFSPSTLEGGPIPLLEAMMSNLVPVVSRTGFAPDVIRHGVNGFLFDVGAPAEVMAALVEQAYLIDTDVRQSIIGCTWDRFATAVFALL